MAYFIKEVSRLTDQQLRTKLNSLGEAVGPIVPNLRPLFENRLVKYFVGSKNDEADFPEDDSIQGASGGNSTDFVSEQTVKPVSLEQTNNGPIKDHENSNNKREPPQKNESETTMFYGVGLPEDAEVETGINICND